MVFVGDKEFRLGRIPRPHREQWRFGLHPSTLQPNQSPMVRSGVIPETTFARKNLPTHHIRAPRDDTLR
jgi:hypothetical protein